MLLVYDILKRAQAYQPELSAWVYQTGETSLVFYEDTGNMG